MQKEREGLMEKIIIIGGIAVIAMFIFLIYCCLIVGSNSDGRDE